MHRQPDQDKDFYSDYLNWRGNPTYDVTLIVQKEFPFTRINTAVIEAGKLVIISDVNVKMPLKSVLEMGPGLPSIGLFHTFVYRPATNCSTYQLSIYPEHFKRLMGADLSRPWNKMDRAKVKTLHAVLFNLIRTAATEVPLLAATIARQDDGFVKPEACARSICIDHTLADVIGVSGRQLKTPFTPYSRFMAIDL